GVRDSVCLNLKAYFFLGASVTAGSPAPRCFLITTGTCSINASQSAFSAISTLTNALSMVTCSMPPTPNRVWAKGAFTASATLVYSRFSPRGSIMRFTCSLMALGSGDHAWFTCTGAFACASPAAFKVGVAAVGAPPSRDWIGFSSLLRVDIHSSQCHRVKGHVAEGHPVVIAWRTRLAGACSSVTGHDRARPRRWQWKMRQNSTY